MKVLAHPVGVSDFRRDVQEKYVQVDATASYKAGDRETG